jgi:hypothetical protein
MKIKHCLLLFCVTLLLVSCNQKSNSKVINDTVAVSTPIPEGAAPMRVVDDKIYIELTINDSISVTKHLDTGAGGISMSASEMDMYNLPYDKEKLSSIISYGYEARGIRAAVQDIKLGNQNLGHSHIFVYKEQVDLFAPNYGADKRIWELNFSEGYVKIIDADTVPPHSMILPFTSLKGTLTPVVHLPMRLVGKNNDTLFTDFAYLLDTGTPHSVLFLEYVTDADDFAQRQLHVGNHFVVKKIILNDGAEIDFGRFAKWHPMWTKNFPVNLKGTLGVNFLKHFNVFIDFKNMKIYLQKHDKTYKHQYSNLGCYISRSKSGILRLGRFFSDSPIYKLGVKGSPEIIEINGIPAENIDEDSIKKLYAIPANTPVKMTIVQDSVKREIEFMSYENPLNYYNNREDE